MDIKEILNQLVQKEKKRLEEYTEKLTRDSEREVERFEVLRSMLEETSDAVNPELVRLDIEESRATLTLHNPRSSLYSTPQKWTIEPAVDIEFKLKEREAVTHHLEGFELTHIVDIPEVSTSYGTSKFILKNEEAVMEYLLKEIAYHVAMFED